MIFEILRRLVKQGCSDQFNEETNRKIVVINLFAFVGVSITLVLGLRALTANDYPLSLTLLFATTLFGVSQQLHLRIDGAVGRILSMNLLLTCLMGLMAILIVTGGESGTGPLWIYIVPPVAMFFGGFRRGLMSIFGFTLLISVLLFFPDGRLLMTNYTFEFKTRLIYSFMTVTFLSAFYEYSRQRTFETLQRLSEQFEQQALHDPLTRLPNRRGIQQHLSFELARIDRNGRPFSVVLADIDHFKSINDTYGHDNGDNVLTRISKLFVQRLRRQDQVARWGGEEFLFVLPETPENNAVMLADKIRQTLAQNPILLDGKRIDISASFGVCEVNADVELDRALSLADKALYKAKSMGRNCVVAATQLSD
ncbi:GGDEF domain-containing protein [Alteromonas antoniana]|uniref:GGDEF domain-containing protein n=1 Tax=Alteromonas antoniana TaxID=2803813 RepID=UPI001C654A10|nr:GGDEF domain-containing protein [Alteromonas antoniana]